MENKKITEAGVSVLLYLSGNAELDQKTEKYLQDQTCGMSMLQIVKEDINSSKSESYNRFLEQADRELLTVVNPGDSFKPVYFEKVLEAYREHASEADFFMTNKQFFYVGRKRKRVFLPDRLREKRAVINIWEQENCAVIPVFMLGTFLKTEVAKQFPMDPALGMEAEKAMLLRMTLEHRNLYYMHDLMYHYKTPEDSHPHSFPGANNPEWYYESFSEFFMPFMKEVQEKYGEVPRYLQYVLAHYVTCRLAANMDNKNKRVIREDGETYMRSLSGILQFVGDDVLADLYKCPTYTDSIDRRLLLMRLKMNDANLQYEYHVEEDVATGSFHGVPFFSTKDLEMDIQFMEYRNGCLEIDCKIKSYFPLNISEYYVTLGEKKYELLFEERFSHTFIFGCTVSRYHTFHVSVPLNKDAKRQELAFWMDIEGQPVKLKMNFGYSYSKIMNNAAYGYWRFNRFIAYVHRKNIIIKQAAWWYTAYRELRIWLEWMFKKKRGYRKFTALRMMYFLTRPYFKKQKIWLFQDKVYKGGDSSEYLYKYAMKQEDGIKKYYLLDETAPDYARLKKEGYEPLKKGSLKHKMVFLNADMVVASNSMVFSFNGYIRNTSAYITDLANIHAVCVQHGLSVQNIARPQNRLKDNTRLYFCASKYEIENLSRPIYNYNRYDALKLTGVPRYDGLIDEAKKQILITPTWRMQSTIMTAISESMIREYNPHFKETNYYKVYNSLINDQRLIDAAREYGYRLVYVLHPIVSPQAKDFDKNEYVDIVPSTGDMSYEKVFRESSLMVTDYSGVQFDFAYMRKPLVYLHHDDIPKHYEEGIFTYDTMAFGEICRTNEELIDVLCDYMKNGCQMKELYKKRADEFFAFNDHNNCQRIYDVMLEYQKNVVDAED